MAKPGGSFEPAVFTRPNADRMEGRTGPVSLEEQMKRLGRRQEIAAISAGCLGALALAIAFYVAVRVDRLSEAVSKLPAQVNEAIKQAAQENAQNSRPPQVLVLPTTQLPNPSATAPTLPAPVVLGPHSSNR